MTASSGSSVSPSPTPDTTATDTTASDTTASDTARLTAGPSARPLAAAKTPVGVGPISVAGPVLALLCLGAGAVLVWDALVWGGLVTGTAWTQQVAARLNGLTPSPWAVVVGVAAVVLGVLLLVVALRRRPRRGIALDAATGVFLRPVDVARLARARAEEVDGVLTARASATTRGVTVVVTGTTDARSGGRDLAGAVREAVTQRLAALARRPAVRVTVEGARR